MKYEELARRLLETPPREWPGALPALRVEKKTMPPQLRARLQAMGQEKSSPPGEIEEGRKASAPAWRRPLIAAAALILAAGGGWWVYLQIAAPGAVQASVEYVHGVVRGSAGDLQQGQSLRAGDILRSEAGAVAGLAVKSPAAAVAVRLFSQSTLAIVGLQSEQMEFQLSDGALHARLDAVDGAAPTLRIRTQFSQSTVVGTRFALEHKGSELRLSTFEGRVAFRRRLPELDELPPELFSRSELLQALRQVLIDASASVGASSESTVAGDEVRTRFARLPALQAMLSGEAVTRLRQSPAPAAAEIDAALVAIEAAYPGEAERQRLIADFRAAFGDPPVVRSLDSFENEERERVLLEPGPEEREARFQALLRDHPQMSPTEFASQATRVLGKAPQRIELLDGTMVFGVIYGEGGQYRVYTAQGPRLLRPDQIREIYFE